MHAGVLATRAAVHFCVHMPNEWKKHMRVDKGGRPTDYRESHEEMLHPKSAVAKKMKTNKDMLRRIDAKQKIRL